MRLVTSTSSLAFLALLTLAADASAQLDITGALKRGAEREANRQAEQLGREFVRCAIDNLKCIKKAEKKGKDVVLVDENGNVVEESDDGGGKPPGLSSSSTSASDFRPGTRVLFQKDFTTVRGDFPGSLDPIQGQMRVYGYHYLNVGQRQTAGLWAPRSQKLATSQETSPSQRIVPVKVMVQGDELKMYVGERRVAHFADSDLGRSDKIYFFLDSSPPENLTYIGNIRIAEIEY